MTAYLYASLAWWLLLIFAWTVTKPGTPRKPHTHGQIVRGLLFSCVWAAWALLLLAPWDAP